MDKITEIIPDDIPQWAQDAMDKGQLWTTVFDRIEELEAEIKEQKTVIEYHINDKCRLNSAKTKRMIKAEDVAQRKIKELEAMPKFHHPDCNWWKWDWRYSWHKTDCNCEQVAGPPQHATKEAE